MRKYLLILSLFILSFVANAQEINCNVEIITTQIQTTNKDIFTDLKNSIIQFMNNRKWTGDGVQTYERIDCNFIIEIQEFNIDQFKARLTIQSSRPVYGTNYNTVVFKHVDESFDFQYSQLQAMDFQENIFSSNLTSVLGYYAYLIIGMDYDSYRLSGGTDSYNKAMAIKNAASSIQGWGPNDGKGNKNRYYLIENILDDRFKPMRTAMYQYHIKGLDIMNKDMDGGREAIYEALLNMKKVFEVLPNSVSLKVFFNAKNTEIISIFSRASPSLKNKVVELLGKIDPSNRNDYESGILKN
jgi:uncharacterized protein YutD